MTSLVDRAFVRLPMGLIHYRSKAPAGMAPSEPGSALPLVLIHGGPFSSAGLVELMMELATGRRVIAPDLMGMGDSDPSPEPSPTIASYARVVIQTLDHLGVDRFDLYGHHSGAQIACEIAIAHSDRVGGLVLDGLALFPDDVRAEFQSRYAPPIHPSVDGRHVTEAWSFVSNMTVHFPYYCQDEAHRIANGATMPAAVLTDWLGEILKTWRTVHLLYRAAFSHDLRSALKRTPVPATILAVEGDPLAIYGEEAASLLRSAVCLRPARTPQDKARAILGVL